MPISRATKCPSPAAPDGPWLAFRHSARRSATRISPGSAPPAPRAASTSSRCCAQATMITSSTPRRSPRERALATHVIARLIEHPDRCFAGHNAWNAHLEALGVSALKVNPDPVMVATEAALWGSVKAHGFLPDTVIVSDDAGQFNVGQHGLCWVHSERLVHKLDAFTDENRPAQYTARKLIWNFYRDLKAYRCGPTKQRKAALRARFDRIFKRKTGFVTLDRLLARLNANKPALLMVLDRPEIPLHTNGSENDIRCHVTRRKISAGTRSDIGRDCRDAFLGLVKTCAKLEIAFWDYLGDRLAIPGAHTVPRLPEIILARAQSP